MDCSVRPRLAAPLNLPADLASVTVPETEELAGIALAPWTDTDLARLPEKSSPALLVFELNALPRRTDSVVPAGTTIGGGGDWGAGGASAGGATGIFVAEAAEDGVVAGLLAGAGGVCGVLV